jgi:signal transduction histidine kinase
MMKKSFFKTGSLRFVSFIYWIFLTYMIAAFIWWYVSLEKQNDEIASIKFNSIQLNDTALKAKMNSINVLRTRKQKQFLGEGLTFLILFLLGAVYVYRSLKKQLNYSNQQQNFMMAVTHELKTPIAVTQLNLETLQKRTLSEEQQKKLIDNALKTKYNFDFSNTIVSERPAAGKNNSSLELALEAGIDISPKFSLSTIKILTANDPLQWGINYRINNQFRLRSSTNLTDDTRAVIEFERRF